MKDFEIEKDLEHEAKLDAYVKYTAIKRRGNFDYRVNPTDWAHAWEYAKEYYKKQLEESKKECEELQKQLDASDKEFERFARK